MGGSTSGVLFHDAGNVYSTASNLSFSPRQEIIRTEGDEAADFDYMVHAVGLGVRYRTPIGPVRIDVAYALNPPRYFRNETIDPGTGIPTSVRTEQRLSNVQFHFSLGQTF